jgi:hypothetical protein
MDQKKSIPQFTEAKEVLMFVINTKHYKDKASYIKAMVNILGAGLAVYCCLFWGVDSLLNHSYVNNKVNDHFTMVREKMQEGKSELDRAEKSFEGIRESLDNVFDKEAIKSGYNGDYMDVHEKRMVEKEAREQEELFNEMRHALETRTLLPHSGTNELDSSWFYGKMSCYSRLKEYLFALRSRLIAGDITRPRLTKEIAKIKALRNIGDIERSQIARREEEIRNIDDMARSYNLNDTDADLARSVMNDEDNKNIGVCLREIKRILPILIQHDWSDDLINDLVALKEMADFLDIAKEVDWTVPFMVVQEEKDYKQHMWDWKREYVSKHKVRLGWSSSHDSPERVLYEKEMEKERLRYVEMMNEKYRALGDNPGLKYAIFTEYRNKKGVEEKGWEEYFGWR